ncbi:MAG: murein biosynthesis integral membrane protein MurJ, partial [bacterium]
MDVNKNKRITSYIGSITTATFISRILGFIRDAMVAYLFGATAFSDAFYAAYRIANLFRRLFGEGAFSSAFIPILSQYVAKDKKKSYKFIRIVMGNLLTIVLFLTFLCIIFAPQLIYVLASGFRNNPAQFTLTIKLTRIMMPYFIFISLAACLMGVLQVHKKFFIPALAPLSLSLSIIIYIGIIVPFFLKGYAMSRLVIGLAVAVLIGGFGQLLFMVPSYLGKGYWVIPKIKFNHPGSIKVFRLMIPAMFSISIDQINMFISATFLASFLAKGSVTALYYSDRLTQLPLALFGIAAASVALPLFSEAIARKRIDDFKQILGHTVKIVGYLVIPSIVGLAVLGKPIIRLLFERGAFDARATSMTYAALIPFAIGIIAFSLVKILANAFFSMQDMKKPVIISSACMVLNVILAVILMQEFGITGLASASTLAAVTNMVLLIIALKKKIGSLF